MTKEIALINRERTIVGTARDLETTLRNLHARGVLVSPPTSVAPMRTGSGMLAVKVVVQEPAPTTSRRERMRLWSLDHEVASACIKAGAFGIGVASAVLGLILAALAVIAAVLTDLAAAAKPMAGSLVLGALCLFVLMSVKRGHPCPGLHCPNCKGH